MSKVILPPDPKEILRRLTIPLINKNLKVNIGQCCGKYFASIGNVKLCSTCKKEPINTPIEKMEELEIFLKNLS